MKQKGRSFTSSETRYNSTMAGKEVRVARMAWWALSKSCSLGSLLVMKQLYPWFNPAVRQNQVILLPSDDFVSLKQEHMRSEAESPLHGSDVVEAAP